MRDWSVKRFGDICEIVNGSTPLRTNKDFWENGDFPWFTIDDIREQGRVIRGTRQKITQLALKKLRILPPGTILLCCTASIGEYALTEIELTTNQQFNGLVIKNKREIHPQFLMYFCSTLKDTLSNLSGKATIDFIPISRLKDIPIPLPSLPEQQSIVAILDETFAAIAKAKANAEQNLKNAKELFESYLQGVFEHRGEGWEEKTLGEIAFVKSGGTPSRAKKEYWEGNIAWYSSGELNDLYTKDPERFINELAINNSNAKLFPKGSLLIGMYDTAALKMSIIDRDATFNQAIAGVKPNDKIDLTFVLHSINSIKPDLLNLRRGVRQKNLSLEKIKNIPIFLPSLTTQQSIVQKLDALSAQTKKLEAIYQQKINDLEELKKAILQKAFSGELKTAEMLAV
jgi:type I restriction enzyme S subunit